MMQNVIFLSLFLFISTGITAQQVIPSAGTHATGINAQLTWTIGEPVISTISGSRLQLTQGFNQGNLTISAIEPFIISGIVINVYPNPFSETLQIELTGYTNEAYFYIVTDVNGRIIKNGLIDQNLQSIDMNRLAQGVYFLMISEISPPKVQTFKIVKQ